MRAGIVVVIAIADSRRVAEEILAAREHAEKETEGENGQKEPAHGDTS